VRFSLRQWLAPGADLRLTGSLTAESLRRRLTRRVADSNRCTGLCRPLPNHSANSPRRALIVPTPGLGASPSIDPQPSAMGLAPNPTLPQYHARPRRGAEAVSPHKEMEQSAMPPTSSSPPTCSPSPSPLSRTRSSTSPGRPRGGCSRPDASSMRSRAATLAPSAPAATASSSSNSAHGHPSAVTATRSMRAWLSRRTGRGWCGSAIAAPGASGRLPGCAGSGRRTYGFPPDVRAESGAAHSRAAFCAPAGARAAKAGNPSTGRGV
jgi:hypothetical protein